jgi:hypothetical protein
MGPRLERGAWSLLSAEKAMRMKLERMACIGLGSLLLSGCMLKGGLSLTNLKLVNNFSFDSSGLVDKTVVHLDRMKAIFDSIVVVKASFENAGTITADIVRKLPKDCDVVFVVDNTGSMGWSISKVQNSVVDAMREAPDRHYGVVTYRDIGSSYESRVAAPLAGNLEASIAAINAMEADEGGDFPEFVAAGLDAGLEQPWRADKAKHIILIGDAPDKGHKNPITMDTVAKKAKERKVQIHAVGLPCGDTCKKELGTK